MISRFTRMFKRSLGWAKVHLPTFLLGFGFAILCFVGLNAAMKPFSTAGYCGGQCHEMNISYQSWELSPHGTNANGVRVTCVDCHLPPKDRYFAHVAMKGYTGAKDIYKHYFGPEYDREKIRQKVLEHFPRSRCLQCHNTLLARPGSPAARLAHVDALADLKDPEMHCLKCHESTGHERESRLFAP